MWCRGWLSCYDTRLGVWSLLVLFLHIRIQFPVKVKKYGALCIMCNMSTNPKEFTPVLKGKIELIKADIYNVKMKKILKYRFILTKLMIMSKCVTSIYC